MSLSPYLNAVRGLFHELQNTLSTPERATMTKTIREQGKEQWCAWLEAHETESLRFLHATPGQRAKRTAWKQAGLRQYLTLGAMIQARKAADILEAAEELHLLVGRSYRDVACLAAEIAAHHEGKPRLWPWDEELF